MTTGDEGRVRRPSRRAWLWGMAASMAAAAAACKGGDRTTNTDGRPEEGARRPLVSLSPSLTETLLALGAGSQLLGVSDYCRVPEDRDYPRLGTALTPNLEALARLPDRRRVLVIANAMKTDWTAPLRGLVDARALPWSTPRELAQSVHTLGQWVDRGGEARSLAAGLTEALKAAPPVGGARVAVLLDAGGGADDGAFWFVKSNSLHGSALHGAGFRNAFDGPTQGPPKVGAEQLMAADPDVVVVIGDVTWDPSRARAAVAPVARLAPLRANRLGAVGTLAYAGALSEGPGLVEFSRRLRRTVAPLVAGGAAP